ncbi:MAG TPA: signal peptidase I [Verrucomicrobiales bacterium]|nr:signal peptidase I [Verrucomicrobiales bacterium]
MFTPRYLKEARLLFKGVSKFLHYKRDLLPQAKLAEIERLRAAFGEAIASRDRDGIAEAGLRVREQCERAFPPKPQGWLRENVEVFFVAVVIALGIRSYFLQPFKIPTGSMQPTLNGVIATPLGAALERDPDFRLHPSFPVKVFDYVVRGRNYVDVTAPADFEIGRIYQKDYLKFFSFTYVEPRGGGKPLRIYAPLTQALQLGLGRFIRPEELSPDKRMVRLLGPKRVTEGAVLAQGYVDTGDQVLVNKFAYHFRPPRRGEVFVFTTKGITGIEVPPEMGSQHYIKRLAGTPGDTLEIREPELFLNGERAQEAGFRRVMEAGEEGYRGYEEHRGGMRMNEVRLGAREYFALGDNSFSSSDSRSWGVVPESNLVGPGLLVYWPFDKHFGWIR